MGSNRFVLGGLVLSVLLLARLEVGGHEAVDYRTEVEPILQQSCGGMGCHMNEEESGVEMTTYQALMASFGKQYQKPIVIPGDPATSPLIDKIVKTTPT